MSEHYLTVYYMGGGNSTFAIDYDKLSDFFEAHRLPDGTIPHWIVMKDEDGTAINIRNSIELKLSKVKTPDEHDHVTVSDMLNRFTPNETLIKDLAHFQDRQASWLRNWNKQRGSSKSLDLMSLDDLYDLALSLCDDNPFGYEASHLLANWIFDVWRKEKRSKENDSPQNPDDLYNRYMYEDWKRRQRSKES